MATVVHGFRKRIEIGAEGIKKIRKKGRTGNDSWGCIELQMQHMSHCSTCHTAVHVTRTAAHVTLQHESHSHTCHTTVHVQL